MSRVLDLLLRLAVIIAGYAAASVAASAMMHLLFLGSQQWTTEEAAYVTAGSFILSVPFVALFVAYFACIPGFAAILLGEIAGARSWLYYALSGGVVGVFVAWFLNASTSDTFTGVADALAEGAPANDAVADPHFLALMTASGIVGGLGYWLVAGRTAGSWRRRPPTSPAPTGS